MRQPHRWLWFTIYSAVTGKVASFVYAYFAYRAVALMVVAAGLFDVYGLQGMGVRVGGRFEGPDGLSPREPIVEIPLDAPRLTVPARSLSASAELFIDWRIGAGFEGGVAAGTARLTTIAGALVSALLALLIGIVATIVPMRIGT